MIRPEIILCAVDGTLTPSALQHGKFPGWKMHTYTLPNSICDGPITNLLWILKVLIEIFLVAHEKGQKSFNGFKFSTDVVKCCLMSSDVSWHIRDKLWPVPKHGSINLYVHGNQKARYDGQPRTSTSTLTQLLNYDLTPSDVAEGMWVKGLKSKNWLTNPLNIVASRRV